MQSNLLVSPPSPYIDEDVIVKSPRRWRLRVMKGTRHVKVLIKLGGASCPYILRAESAVALVVVAAAVTVAAREENGSYCCSLTSPYSVGSVGGGRFAVVFLFPSLVLHGELRRK